MTRSYVGIAGRDPGAEIPLSDPLAIHARISRDFPGIPHPFGLIGHDAAAAVVRAGRIVFAVEEERLNRIKHSYGLPSRALEAAREHIDGDANLAYYLDPTEQDRMARLALRLDFGGTVDNSVSAEFQSVRNGLSTVDRAFPGIQRVSHHLSHAASAFYPSGFSRALVLVADGYGESQSTSLYLGDERGLHHLQSWGLASSLGLLYARLTMYLGFSALEDEYKIMGLAAYAEDDEYRSFFDELVKTTQDGGYSIPSLQQSFAQVYPAWSKALGPARRADAPIDARHIAIAHSLQKKLERTVLGVLRNAQERHSARYLCMAGGVALNCAMNGVIDRSGLFDEIWVQPAATDAGTALGCAIHRFAHDHPGMPFERMEHVYFGPSYDDRAVESALRSFSSQISWTRPVDYIERVAGLLAQGNVVGWYQGAMEFGPRALGNRSILADPRRADMKDIVNRVVKKREEFRPFAPSVVAEEADKFFRLRSADQYSMMTVAALAQPGISERIPAVIHVDGTARVHVVRRAVNTRYWELLMAFGARTGVPVLLNTSFNVKGEPIVCTPEHAIACFLGTGIDVLAIQGFLVTKV